MLLDERLNGNVSDDMFKTLMVKYESSQKELLNKLSELKAELSIVKDDTENIKHLMESFKKSIYIENLDRDTVVS